MAEMIDILTKFGGTVVLACLFIYQWTVENSKTQSALDNLANATRDIADILRHIQEQNNTHKLILEQHTKDILEIKEKLNRG